MSFSKFINDVWSCLIRDISSCYFVVDLLLECFELVNEDWEVLVESSSLLNGNSHTLELSKLLLVLVLWCILTVSIDPVNSLVEFVDEISFDCWVNVLLKVSILLDVVSYVVDEWLEFILDCLEFKDRLVFIEPCCFCLDELGLHVWRDCMGWRVYVNTVGALLVLLSHFEFLLRSSFLLLLFLLHWLILSWSLTIWLSFSLWSWLGWSILLYWDLFLFNPFLL